MHIQPVKTVHCISIDPDPVAGGVGGSEWRADKEAAERLYQQMSIDPTHDGDTLIRFDLLVPEAAEPWQITDLVDAAAWEHNYTEIRRVTVAVEH
jgi:hypothetical protein